MTCNLTTEMRRRGGQARQQRPDAREHQRRAGRRSAQVQDMRALGRLGFEATAARYGHNFAFDRARRWRLEHPSSLEQQVMRILDENWIDYEREAQVLGDQVPIAVDFYLAEHNLVVEVNGKVHTDPFFNQDGDRWTRERLRRERLERAGFQVLVIDHRDLSEPGRVVRKLKGALDARHF